MRSIKNKTIKNVFIICVILLLFVILAYLCLTLIQQGTKEKTLNNLGFQGPLSESQVIEQSMDSDYMDQNMDYILYLPKGYGNGETYPVWYGLNGYSSDETMWINSGIAKIADKLIDSGKIEPMIMVFPYTKDATIKEITKDLEDGKIDERNIDRYICNELVSYIDANYYTVAKPEKRYIGGFSMGGMISLRIAFHHTELFGKVGGYSAAVISNDYSDKQLEEWLYPNDIINDIESFDRKKGFHKLIVQLDAGNSNDPFTQGLQSLYDALQKRGVPSEFVLNNGGHTLQEDRLGDYLTFYAGKN